MKGTRVFAGIASNEMVMAYSSLEFDGDGFEGSVILGAGLRGDRFGSSFTAMATSPCLMRLRQ